jgi:hypothetical protein
MTFIIRQNAPSACCIGRCLPIFANMCIVVHIQVQLGDLGRTTCRPRRVLNMGYIIEGLLSNVSK